MLEQHCINTGAVLDHCSSGAVLGWFGAVLEQYCGCIEEILEQCCSSTATRLEQYWSSIAEMLEQYWIGAAKIPEQCWSKTPAVLEQRWSKKSISLRFERLFQNLIVRQAWFRSGSRPTVAVSAQY